VAPALAALTAFIVLGYVLAPFVAWFIHWLWTRAKKTGGDDRETDT
jgi:hypothetical protein